MPKGQVTIRDLVITPILEQGMIYTGEATPYSGANRPLTDDPDVVPRLTNCINELIDIAALDHQTHNTTKDLNYITRLSTHEFFFYTQKPLSLQEFETLQNNIALKLKTIPPGIQLILGSFAVINAHHQIMNVTPHISSGNPASFHFIVKNYTSPIDVRYKNPTGEVFETWDNYSDNDESPASSITIDDQIRALQLEPMIPCTTEGATPFLTLIDICLDHFNGVSKKYLSRESEHNPEITEQPISQVVISNTVHIHPEHCILGPILHVDPVYSTAGCKYGVTQTPSTPKLQHGFGKNKISLLCLEPSVCDSGDEFHISSQMEDICIKLKKTAVGDADKKSSLQSIISFIEHYGDVNAVINAGITPLHYAVQQGLNKAAQVLIENDADVNAKTNSGLTALFIAVNNGNIDIVSALLAKRATIDTETLLSAEYNENILRKLVNTILTQDNPNGDIQSIVIQFIFDKTIKADCLTKPIKDPILRAKVYLTEKDIDPKKVTAEDMSMEAALFIKLYRNINAHEVPLKQEFQKMLMDLMNTKKPEKIDLVTQVITHIYAINPDDITIKFILDRFVNIAQSAHIPLSKSPTRDHRNKETDLKTQLFNLKLAYLKFPYDDGQKLHDEFKILCKIFAYRRHSLDFFGTPTSMQNLAQLLSTDEYAELRSALKITSNHPKTLLKLIHTYANQTDIDDYEPGKPIPTIKKS